MRSSTLPRFSLETLRFLRALKRNNNRDWFKARKDEYETSVRQPMVAVIERLAVDFRRFAPELIASPQKSLYRIYRDTRFSENKTPLKTHVAAGFPWKGLPRHEGAGLYFEVAGAWVWRATGQLKKDSAARDWTAFAGAISIFTLAFAGLAYSIFPYVVIDRITLWQAASHPSALKMVLIGVALVLPFLLGYTIFAHRVFRGKAQALLH